jgi:alkanesulfonate monooxygenase SsuD/methylene tetrahydromethanopterin reductase-like flavin-dependent oxidoreductase (luciferase family)
MFVIGKAIGFDAIGDAQRAEAAGYDGIRAIDHFFSGIPPAHPEAVPHCFVTLAAAAAATSRVLLTQTMVAATLRHPFEVAQAVACLDRISNGRAELGIGTAWLPIEHEAMGLALGTPGERVGRAVEAATICRQMFANQGCVDFEGTFFKAHSDAAWPVTPHVPEIVMGAHGRRMIQAAAGVADRVDLVEALSGGRPNFDGDHLNSEENLAARIDLARSSAVGRDVTLTFSGTVNIVVTADHGERDERRAALAEAGGCAPDAFNRELLRVIDDPDGAIERFRVLARIGIDRVHVRPMDPPTAEWLSDALPTIRGIN